MISEVTLSQSQYDGKEKNRNKWDLISPIVMWGNGYHSSCLESTVMYGQNEVMVES